MNDTTDSQTTSEAPERQVLSRDELYALVWEMPLNRIGLQFGISGGRMATLCDRAGVPYPAPGYWQKVASGKKVKQTPLPPAGAATPATIELGPPKGSARQWQPAAMKPIQPAPKEHEPVPVPASSPTPAATAETRVPARLTRPHPIIAKWQQEHEERRREAKRNRGGWSPPFEEWTENDHRRHRILDAIFKAMEKRGYSAKVGDRGELYLAFDREKVVIKLREKQRQVRKPLTADELRWRSPGGQTWKQVLEPTGTLVFTVETYFREGGIRKEWRETDSTRLEDQVDDIVENLAKAGPALVKERALREEEEARRREAERLRQIEADRRRQEANRWRRFVELARRWEEVELARRFLAGLQRAATDPNLIIEGRTVAEWATWVEERAAALDPLMRGESAVYEDLAAVTSWTYRD